MEPFFAFFDLPVQRVLSLFAEKSVFFDKAMGCVVEDDLFKGVALFALFVGAWFSRPAGEAVEKREARREKLFVTFFVTLVAVGLARATQKLLWVHERPVFMEKDRLDALGLHFPPVVDPDFLNTFSSFPSDHAVYFAALATGLWLVNRRLGLLAFLWTVFVIGLPRVYLGLHNPSDVVAGCLLGVLLMLAAQRVVWFQRGARRALAWGRQHEGLFYGGGFFLVVNAALLFDEMRHIASGVLKYLGH